ncbi:MAG: hypothetical protein ABWY29_10665 [Blastococcus sp.]
MIDGVASSPSDSLDYVYAIGRITPRFPSVGVEKEFAQAMARSETAGLNDSEALRNVLSERRNRYLARQMNWVFSVQGVDTYLVVPRDPADIDQFIETVRASPNGNDMDAIVGIVAPIAPQGLRVVSGPIVVVDVVYAFDSESIIASIPRPEGFEEERFEAAAREVFSRIVQISDNVGAMAEHRAVNYLVLRYPAVYALVAEQYARDAALDAVTVVRSRLRGSRNIFDVIFAFRNRSTDFVEKFFVRVDVTEEFPFLLNKLSSYFDR